MPLVAAAVCPHPPLLVPAVAAGAAGELAELRAACRAAVTRVLAAGPELLVVVGAGPGTRGYTAGSAGSLRGYGVDLPVSLGPRDPTAPDHLPLSLLLGAWLLAGQPVPAAVRLAGWAVDPAEPPRECARLGRELVAGAPVGLLVMADGSACRGEKAPGYADERAEPFDARVTAALAAADREALLALDPALATELRAAGRAPWQVLAGAAEGTRPRGTVSYDAAPYGVQYTVAVWA